MPRPKGSKNKAKPTTQSTDFTSLIAEKSSSKEALVADIASLEENLTALKADLKAKKAELKKLDTELGKLEEQKAAFDAVEAEKAKKAELEETIQKLMADGVSAAEILEKLK
jgi:septal ring factor EnvC (AmiA/AmiB activator)